MCVCVIGRSGGRQLTFTVLVKKMAISVLHNFDFVLFKCFDKVGSVGFDAMLLWNGIVKEFIPGVLRSR